MLVSDLEMAVCPGFEFLHVESVMELEYVDDVVLLIDAAA